MVLLVSARREPWTQEDIQLYNYTAIPLYEYIKIKLYNKPMLQWFVKQLEFTKVKIFEIKMRY